jgi:hypothetical protein
MNYKEYNESRCRDLGSLGFEDACHMSIKTDTDLAIEHARKELGIVSEEDELEFDEMTDVSDDDMTFILTELELVNCMNDNGE